MNFRKKRTAVDQGFQIAPMLDVVFLLLCFFVTSQVFSQWETEIDIRLPTAETGDIPERLPGEIIVNIREDGYRWSVEPMRAFFQQLALPVADLVGMHPVGAGQLMEGMLLFGRF